MNNDKLVTASCSCEYSITVTTTGCTADWYGPKWFDAGDHTCVTIGVSDPSHCSIRSIQSDGSNVNVNNPIINYNDIQANHNIVAICECRYNVIPNSPTCNISPSTS